MIGKCVLVQLYGFKFCISISIYMCILLGCVVTHKMSKKSNTTEFFVFLGLFKKFADIFFQKLSGLEIFKCSWTIFKKFENILKKSAVIMVNLMYLCDY